MKLITATRGAWFAGLLLLAQPVLAAEVAYTLEPGHTETRFNWTHLGFSHPGAGFDDITGSLRWNAADLRKSSVTVDIAVASIHTHVPLLDKILLSHKYFDAVRYPKITFVSTRVESTRQANHFRVVGNLTVHGITKPVVLDVTRNQTGSYPMFNIPAMGFDASTHFKRSDFGLGEGVPYVSDEIRVRITTEALEAESLAKAKPAMDAMAAKAAQEAQSEQP